MKPSFSLNELTVGMGAQSSKIIEESDIESYAKLSGDVNPVHLNEEYAKTTRFKSRIAHGMLSAGFFSALFANELPGPGAIYIRQNLEFKYPVYLGDKVDAHIEVKEINDKTNRVVFLTQCKVGERLVIDGEAEILLP